MSSRLRIRKIDTSDSGSTATLRRLRQELSPRGEVVSEESRRRTIAVFGEPLSPAQVVERICRDVQSQGLSAVLDFTQRIDGKTLRAEELRVPEEELREAHRRAEPSFLEAVRRIRANIQAFQSAILQRDVRVTRPGSYLVERYRPLRRVGICVPGGAAAYPSTLLMTVVPAQVAGVQEIAVMAPPTDFGAYNADILATCWELGVQEVYRMGGAQGVAALAYGTEICPRVDKIVGPGNLFVALAKKLVFGEVDIDSIAGPSEVVVIADRSANPRFTAFDMLAQAPRSSSPGRTPSCKPSLPPWRIACAKYPARTWPGAAWKIMGRRFWCATRTKPVASRTRLRRSTCTSSPKMPTCWRRRFATRERSSSVNTARWHSAIMRRGLPTFCPPAEPPVSPGRCRPMIF